MPEAYTRQSSFSNGDVIDAPLFNAEYDQLEAAFGETGGHNHDGTPGAGAPIPFIEKTSSGQTTGVYIDTSVPAEPKIVFRVFGVDVSTVGGDFFGITTAIQHTPDGGVAQPLNTYLDGLEVSVGDAAADAASAAADADRAETAAMTLGIPVYIADAGTYVISDTAENADVVFEGDGTLTLPTVLVKGRRFTARVSSTASIEKRGIIPNPSFSIIGDVRTLTAGDGLELSPGQVVVLEAISTTELEII